LRKKYARNENGLGRTRLIGVPLYVYVKPIWNCHLRNTYTWPTVLCVNTSKRQPAAPASVNQNHYSDQAYDKTPLCTARRPTIL